MPATRALLAPVVVAAMPLLWPAWLNGYPIVFDDTGTYLSQAVHLYLGWDRPIFYSLLLLPLHLTLTTWPVIAAQALLFAFTLHLLQKALLPERSPWWLPSLTTALAVATAAPWFVSELMPDLFTPLLVLTLALLLLDPPTISRGERIWLMLSGAAMIAAQQSSLPLSLALLCTLAPWRHALGAPARFARADVLRLVTPPALAIVALVSVNLVGRGRLALFPYGNMFILARVIYDGPGMDVLRRNCPDAGWRLCRYLDRFPATSDEFLWRPDSPAVLAGGYRRVSADADAIIIAALRAEPGRELRAWFANGVTQLTRFASGDELHACPGTVTPWIERDFPTFERNAYRAARQSNNALAMPEWLGRLHQAVALIGVIGCVVVLAIALRHRHPAALLCAAVLFAITANAFIAGGLSTPHDRYGSRTMLLAPIVAALGAAAWAGRRRDAL